jgi:putative redox protein
MKRDMHSGTSKGGRTVEVKVTWAGEMKFTAESETGASITLETGVKYGGSGKNPTPMEAVAMALASCSGMDMVMILEKMRVNLKKLKILVDARRRDGEPAYFEDIKMTIVVSGEGLTKEQADKAASLSVDKYCSVGVMLKDKATITFETKVE